MSLISREYVLMMSGYNSWQNKGLRALFKAADNTALTEDRGAFFGSIFGTANHLLWGDMLWMSRFDRQDGPPAALDGSARGIAQSTDLTDTVTAWDALRQQTDVRIESWAKTLQESDLARDLNWFSGAAGRDVRKPLALCVTHFFNHQTHHRGQIHAMLTSAGMTPGDTDLFLMPEAGTIQ